MLKTTIKLHPWEDIKYMDRKNLIRLAKIIGFIPLVPRRSKFRIGYNYRLNNWYKQYRARYNYLLESGGLEVMQQWYDDNPKSGYYT